MSDHDSEQVRAAFDRLRHDATEVDTMAALRKLEGRQRPQWLGVGLLGAAAAAILIIVGIAVFSGDDEPDDSVTAGDPTQTPVDGDGVDVASLDGSEWVFVSGLGPDGEIVPAGPRPITLHFDGDVIRGHGGCNDYGAGFTLAEDGALDIGPVESTAEGCGDPVDSIEVAFTSALSAADRLQVEGHELTLTGPGLELNFRTAGGGDEVASLDGTSWQLVQGAGPDGDIPILAGWPITLQFDGDTLGGTAACNGYGGTFTIGDPVDPAGNQITIGELAQTEMACDGDGIGDVMGSEAAFMDAMREVDEILVEGASLVLRGPAGTNLVFDLQAPVPTAELVGQLWLLDTLIDGEAASSVGGDPATLLLDEDGTVEAGTGCRQLTGEYVISGAAVLFTSSSMSGECRPELQDQDSHVVTVLGDGFSVAIDGQRLTLTSQGNEGLGYVAIDEAPDGEPTPAVTLADLDGTTWQLLEGQGPDGEIVPGVIPITIGFAGATVSGQAPCNGYGTDFTLDGSTIRLGPIEGEQEGCAESDIEERYFTALAAAERIQLFGVDPAERQMVLSGPDVDMLFQFFTGVPVPTKTLTVSELLDTRPEGTAAVEGQLLFRGGSWILCEQIEANAGALPFCGGRWVVLTNYDAAVDPHTEPPTSVTDAAFGMADVNPEFEAIGDVVWTPGEQVVNVQLLPDGRAFLPEWPTNAEITEDEQAIVDAFTAVSATGTVDTQALRLNDAVVIGLSDQLVETRTSADLADPANWQLDLEAFRGRVGPFSALELLDGADEVAALAGRHDHCASPPAPIPPGLQDVRHLSIQPTGIDSCIDWWTVDLFVDADGTVIGITLDTWEP